MTLNFLLMSIFRTPLHQRSPLLYVVFLTFFLHGHIEGHVVLFMSVVNMYIPSNATSDSITCLYSPSQVST